MNASTVEGRVLSKWVDCRRRQGPVCEQKMAVLHVDRLTPDRSPFKSVEIIKIAHSLETDSFSAALRRFIGRKGQIKEIRSDNGTNFTGARENLGNPSMHETTTKSMRLYYRRISCGYLTPPPPSYGSTFDGVWESCIHTFQKKDSLSRCRWRQVQYHANIFCKRWSREYLPLLQCRQKTSRWKYCPYQGRKFTSQHVASW